MRWEMFSKQSSKFIKYENTVLNEWSAVANA